MNLVFSTLHRRKEDNKFYILDKDIKEEVQLLPMFDEGYDCPEAYAFAGVKGYEPMTAKEIDTEEQQNVELENENNFIEEKFDGTRGIVQFFSQSTVEGNEIGFARVFSRRISKKTNFYAENTDSLPQIRDINIPDMAGTILDGELFIDGLPFKEVSSTLNCLWDKAVDRQIEKGFISLHTFDIIKYKGIDLRKMTLENRKRYLHLAIEEINSPYIQEVEYYDCGDNIKVNVQDEVLKRIPMTDENQYYYELERNKDTYPSLYNCWVNDLPLTPKAYYELIVSTGGEGVIVKPKRGRYYHKRGREYQKIKKFLTRELILIGFEEPTKEYTGKDKKNWGYWEGDIPVTKHYYNKQVGNLILGVSITPDEFIKLPKKKKFNLVDIPDINGNRYNYKVLEVCVCSGFDDDTRAYFTRNRDNLVGSVIEVKANELFKDTGFMRHPRFLRMRPDKNAEECTWKEHIQ